MLKGAVHIHSTYSKGDLSLRELRDVYRAEGCAFACLTDHAAAFNTESMRRYVAECAELSSRDFLFIAGVEFTCRRTVHVLGLGATSNAVGTDASEVFAHIERCGGISVIAHPAEESFKWIESLETLPHGIEVWNTRHDGRYAPRVATFDLLARLQRRRPDIWGFYGQDLQWRRQYRGLLVDVRAGTLTREDILRSFASGDFAGTKKGLRLPSSGRITEAQRARFQEGYQRSERIRRLMQQARTAARRWGASVPTRVRGHLRRVL